MPRISVDKIVPGMRLKRPIMNEMDVILIGEGVELTDALIKRIRDMGIGTVYVEGESKPKMPKEELMKELNERFKRTENEPHMYMLKKILKEDIEEMYTRNGHSIDPK